MDQSRRSALKLVGLAGVGVAALGLSACARNAGSDTGQTAAPAAAPAAGVTAAARSGAARIAKDATDIPAPITRRTPTTVPVTLEAIELDGQLADGITYTYWTFGGTVPGPMPRVRVGDTVELTLKNNPRSTMTHSIDLHAVTGPGGGAGATEVKPGEEKTFRFKALNPGVFLYHCATAYIPAHIAQGMYGLIVVEPEDGLAPVDREFYVVQGEVYASLRPDQKGHAEFDGDAMWSEVPNFVVFNGAFQALTGAHALRARVGERIRIFIGNAGVNLISSFHIIGEIFDVVHPQGASEAVSNVQTTLIPAGGAAWVEFTAEVPGDYILVDHSLTRAVSKGALAILTVEGPPQPAIFDGDAGAGSGH